MFDQWVKCQPYEVPDSKSDSESKSSEEDAEDFEDEVPDSKSDSESKSSEGDAEEFEDSSEDSADESDDSMPPFAVSSEEGEFSSLEEWSRAPGSINSPGRAATAEENNSDTDSDDEEEVLNEFLRRYSPDCTNVEVVGESRPLTVATPKPFATAACPARDPNRSRSRLWLCDTGCPFDLVSRPNLGELATQIEKAETPQVLDTANDRISASEEVIMSMHPLEEIIAPLILESTPDVLTVGRRCVEEGFGFHWEPYSTKPYFVLPGGKGTMRVGKY